jgi:hypothetical protein
MKPVAQHAAATLELQKDAAWYEQREEGLGQRFFVAVQEVKLFIRQFRNWARLTGAAHATERFVASHT